MNTNSLDPLQRKQLSNVTQLAKLDAIILAANQAIAQAEQSKLKLNEENVHIQYCLDLLRIVEVPTQQPAKLPTTSKPTPLRVTVLGLFGENESMSVAEVAKKAELLVTANRATINTVLHELSKKGKLEKVSLGVYKKTPQSETPAVTGVSGVTMSLTG